MKRPSLLAAALLVALWLALFDLLGAYTYGHGAQSFFLLTVAAGLVVALPWLRSWTPGARSPHRTELLAVLLVAVLGVGPTRVFLEQLNGDPRWAFDIGENTFRAGTAFLAGENPYGVRAQVASTIGPGPHVKVTDGSVTMFGVRYAYGYPYFPVMFLSYLPFRWIAPELHAIRVGNAFFFLLGLVGVFWLTHRLLPRDSRRVGRWLAVAAYLGVSAMPRELWTFAVTDFVIAAYALLAFIAVQHRRPAVAGVLFGLAQSSKLLPGPLLALPLLLWMRRDRGFWPLLLGYVITTAVILVPFVVQAPDLFVSSTILFYLTNHAPGDNSSWWFTLPPALKAPFSAVGYLLTAATVALGVRRRDTGLEWPLSLAFASYALFTAFNKMIHLNYVWGVFALGCVAVVVHAGRATAPTTEPLSG